MADILTTESVENQEVAELEQTQPTESVENQEVAELEETEETEETSKTEQDAAFANMRRQMEEAQQRQAELEEALAEKELYEQAYTEAYENGLEDEDEIEDFVNEYQERREVESYITSLEEENMQLKEQLQMAEIEQLISQDLAEIQKIDSGIKDISELGIEFAQMREAGVSPITAYQVIKQQRAENRVIPPKPMGKMTNEVSADVYTEEELDNLTFDEIQANSEKVSRTMKKLYG